MNERFYKNEKAERPNEIVDALLLIDSGKWKRPRTLTIEKLEETLNVRLNEGLEDKNVTSVSYSDQEDHPDVLPNGIPIIEKTFISVDENYLYVWIPQLKKWKRTLLSNWE